MTFDPTKPVQTRDGRKARIICTDFNGDKLVVLVETNGREYFGSRRSDGRLDGQIENGADLVNIPVKTSTWQHVWRNTGQVYIYKTREACVSQQSNHNVCIGYLRRDYEDGVFVGAEFEPL